MSFIKDFDQFINEGASLVPPNYDKVDLSWKDRKSLPLEVLKTNGLHNVAGFKDKSLPGITKDGSFQIYYGLTVDPDRSKELGDEDPLFKHTLDLLKKSNILNSQAALSEFTKPTADKIRSNKSNINYVVSLGSTAGLSKDLAEAFSLHFNGSKFIPLSKYSFDNFEHALNWKYIRDYDERIENKEQVKEKDLAPILDKVKHDIVDAIDQEKTSPEILGDIYNARNGDELRGIILAADPKNRYHEYDSEGKTTIFWKSTPYNIRSSGIAYGGSREWLKTKYDTPKPSGEFGDASFIEAVKRCILGEETMLFVDDNSRTKKDIRGIFKVIANIANDIFADTDRVDSHMMRTYYKRFLAYVLIYIPDSGEKDITVKKLASEEDVNDFINGGVLSVEDWIRQNKF